MKSQLSRVESQLPPQYTIEERIEKAPEPEKKPELEKVCEEQQYRNGISVCSRRPGIKTCKYQGQVVRITEQNLLAYQDQAYHTFPMWTCTKHQETESKTSGGSK